ncbi:cytochrome b5-like heme/steroid binding domain-containing protein [Pterulicium gracile]|uniref:Cytochrome b5-like heme/steroid binding domain-containing protein n=1 Tax=Pterulicium gracile TaxID=1884261 RepID=A0A5C3QF14_9AGAR|nr:cytochrome b5-like heme/steroid binding domain-containing protein [Pterula gracilis]
MDRQKEREAKIAKGEPVGSPERDPTAGKDLGVLALVKVLFVLLVSASLAGQFLVGSYTWGYDGKWVQAKTYWPATQKLFTETQLAQYDGKDPTKPIYLAVDGDVYDVSANRRTYGPGGSYNVLAGSEGGRSFSTGCFLTHKTHDYRGLTDREMQSVNHWKNFFAEHKDYFKVGRLLQKPIDPASPIPVHCDPKKQEEIDKREAERVAEIAKAAREKDEL